MLISISNSPVKDATKEAINCNTNNKVVGSKVKVKGGDTVTFEWYHDKRGDDIIAESHKGPVTVYIAPLSSDGKGNVWTKLAEDGYSNGLWATERLVQNGGKHDVKIPSQLSPGDYILRAEIIALHEADTDYTKNPNRGAQFYPSCSQITVTSGGSLSPPEKFNFINGYTPTTPGILFDLYNGVKSYPIPGPVVWSGTSGHNTNSMEPITATKTIAPITTTKPTEPITTTKTTEPTTINTANTYINKSKPITSTSQSATTQPSTIGIIQEYYQCGGINHKGSTECASGLKCCVWNQWYSQCLSACQ